MSSKTAAKTHRLSLLLQRSSVIYRPALEIVFAQRSLSWRGMVWLDWEAVQLSWGAEVELLLKLKDVVSKAEAWLMGCCCLIIKTKFTCFKEKMLMHRLKCCCFKCKGRREQPEETLKQWLYAMLTQPPKSLTRK